MQLNHEPQRPTAPSEIIESIFQSKLQEIKEQTDFLKLTDSEKAIVLPLLKAESIIEFLDRVILNDRV